MQQSIERFYWTNIYPIPPANSGAVEFCGYHITTTDDAGTTAYTPGIVRYKARRILYAAPTSSECTLDDALAEVGTSGIEGITCKKKQRSYAFGDNTTQKASFPLGTFDCIKITMPDFSCFTGPMARCICSELSDSPVETALIDCRIKGPGTLVLADFDKATGFAADLVPDYDFDKQPSQPPTLSILELAAPVVDATGLLYTLSYRSPGQQQQGTTLAWSNPLPLFSPVPAAQRESSASWRFVKVAGRTAALHAFSRAVESCERLDIVLGHGVTKFLREEKEFLPEARKRLLERCLVCDTEILAREIAGPKVHFRSAALSDVCGALGLAIPDSPDIGQQHLLAAGAIEKKLNILEITRMIACMSGSPWKCALECKHVEQVDYLLSHEFYERGFVLPSPPLPAPGEKRGLEEDTGGERKHHRGKAKTISYTGGRVLDSCKGLHKSEEGIIAMLDYRSLYPSVIRENGLCFVHKEDIIVGAGGEDASQLLVLPRVVGRLVDARAAAKKAGASTTDTALKFLVNRIYGCIGSEFCRFKNIELASKITQCGRDALAKAVGIAQAEGYDVLMGVSDSIAVQTRETDLAKASAVADKLIGLINKDTTYVKIAIDTLYRAMFIASKNGYAGLPVDADARLVLKGLDLVRHDYCPFASKIGMEVLTALFQPAGTDDTLVDSVRRRLDLLKNTNDGAAAGIADFAITVVLGKDLAQYDRAALCDMPHARAAYESGRNIGKYTCGTSVSYVVCSGEDPRFPGCRRVKLAVVPLSSLLHDVDVDWYMYEQVLPVLKHLLRHIGKDEAWISERMFGERPDDPSPYLTVKAISWGKKKKQKKHLEETVVHQLVSEHNADLLDSLVAMDHLAKCASDEQLLKLLCPFCNTELPCAQHPTVDVNKRATDVFNTWIATGKWEDMFDSPYEAACIYEDYLTAKYDTDVRIDYVK